MKEYNFSNKNRIYHENKIKSYKINLFNTIDLELLIKLNLYNEN